MGRLPRRLLGTLAVLLGLAGCSSRQCAAPTSRAEVSLPPTTRGRVEANLRNLPSLPQRDGLPTPEPLQIPPYRSLTAAQCQCLAVENTVPALLHDEQAGLAGPRKSHTAEVRRTILAYVAAELRNRAAGSALELYYRLAEAEGKVELLGQSIVELSRAVRETQDMARQQLKPPVALDVWTRQLLTAQGDQTQAEMTIDQLNGQLKQLLGLLDAEEWRIWNPELYDVTDQPIDVEAAVAEGLATRPELNLLRYLINELDAASVPAARDVLQSVHPLLGMSRGGSVLAKVTLILRVSPVGHNEAEVRREQLTAYLAEREAVVADEICQATGGVKAHARLAALAWAREKSWQEKLAEVRGRQKQGLASLAEMSSTSMDLFKSRGEVISEVMAWYIAGVKLRQAKGLLVYECLGGGPCRAR
ncbi:MAG: hypothetical protein ACJ8F7_21285 [Gemmataceae bacterium]